MAISLKSYEFRRERERAWSDLEALVATVEKGGITALAAADLSRLPGLYRGALSSLSVARAVSLDRALIEYLESLTGRAYFVVYGTKRHTREALREFFARRLPRAVRGLRWALLLSLALLLAGGVTAYVITRAEPERFYTFVGSAYAQDRGPAASTEHLREGLYDGDELTAEELSVFATHLLSHNAGIGILCFALGFVVGIPVFILIFQNGLVLGAFAALYQQRGLGLDFWGWVLPHGITELGAIVLCGAAGLTLARALIFPGRHTRMANLARTGRDAGVVVLGAVLMFFVAGMIEGFFRQRVTSIVARYTLVGLSVVGWGWYFGLVGRRGAGADTDASTDAGPGTGPGTGGPAGRT